MGRWRRELSVRWLAVMVGVLLPAAVVAAVQSRAAPGIPSDLRLGAAGTASALAVSTTTSTVPDPQTPLEPTTIPTMPARTTLPATPTSRPGTVPPQPSATTTVAPAPSTTSTTTPPEPRSWSGGHDGVAVTLRVQPAPAGQPVSFQLDMTSPGACCVVFLDFGDGGTYGLNCGGTCPGACPVVADDHPASTTHIYAGPGAYTFTLHVLSIDVCHPIPG
ncbi:MAG TPA: hypothetical protein VHT97_15485, partial [Acidimicrobiales bacterium]|nr:hypothetical protein [Acidimicrobiales bacterium]